MNTLDFKSDAVTKCLFTEDDLLQLGGGLGGGFGSPLRVWNFKDVTCKTTEPLHKSETLNTAFCTSAVCKWTSINGPTKMYAWGTKFQLPSTLEPAQDLMASKDSVVFVYNGSLEIISRDELLESAQKSSDIGFNQIHVHSVLGVPKTDTTLVVALHTFKNSEEGDCLCDVYAVNMNSSMDLHSTPFRDEPAINKCPLQSHYSSHTSMIGTSVDGNYIVLSTGLTLCVWSRVTDRVQNVLIPGNVINCKVSPKDYHVTVIYCTRNGTSKLVIYDLKSLDIMHEASSSQIFFDLLYMPSTANYITVEQKGNKSVVLSIEAFIRRKASNLNKETVRLSYIRLSPSSDRMVMSVYGSTKAKQSGLHNDALILRNSSGKYRKQLPGTWKASKKLSDVLFSADGTVLTTVCRSLGIAAVYNAGNAELLQKLDLPSRLPRPDSIVGMLTNTHLMVCASSQSNDIVLVIDIGSAQVVSSLSVDHFANNVTNGETRSSMNASHWYVSTADGMALNINQGGGVRIIKSRKFVEVKRSTTLQRLKSCTPSKLQVH